MIRRMFGTSVIEELPCEYYCVSCDLISSELVVHREGPIFNAVGASSCLPGILPPFPDRAGLLVDGGVLDNLPVETMAASGEGPVVAVDVTAPLRPPRTAPVAQATSLAQDRRPRTGLIVGEAAPLPSLKETMIRTLVLGSIDTAEAARRHADFVIVPEVEEFGMTAFRELDRIVEAGRRAARRALPEVPASLGGLVSTRRPPEGDAPGRKGNDEPDPGRPPNRSCRSAEKSGEYGGNGSTAAGCEAAARGRASVR
jgi:NTE family protein